MRKNKARATIDFETRSAADIRATSWMYARHASTRILCLSFVLPDHDPEDPSLWSPIPGESYFGSDGLQTLERLFDYIRAQGKLPAGLPELVPAYLDAVPHDPFTGQALHYVVRNPGFTVYSVGGGRQGRRRREDGQEWPGV